MEPDPQFSEQLDALVPTEEGRGLLLAALQATVCEDPTVGFAFDDPPGYLWYTGIVDGPAFGIPRAIVIYGFDDDNVYLHWIDLAAKNPGLKF
jgi:hypothetical protein